MRSQEVLSLHVQIASLHDSLRCRKEATRLLPRPRTGRCSGAPHANPDAPLAVPWSEVEQAVQATSADMFDMANVSALPKEQLQNLIFQEMLHFHPETINLAWGASNP